MTVPNRPTSPRTGRLLDISRLLTRLHRRTPTGIDRAELAYVRHYLENGAGGDVRFVLTTPLNTGLLAPRLGAHVVRSAIERWCAPAVDPAAEPAYRRLCDILAAPLGADRVHQAIRNPRAAPDIQDKRTEALIATVYALGAAAGIADPRQSALHRSALRGQGAGGWYLQASHMNLDQPRRLAWLKASGLRRAFLLHDLIPISHPEHFLPGEDAHHHRRMQTLAHAADLVIFNSKMTGDAWRAHLAATDWPQPRGAVVPLGIEDVFLAGRDGPSPEAVAVPYFVAVGTIEARKNIAFLLQVWRQWTQDGHAPPARLVIVGRRGWESENAFDLLDRCSAIAPSVVEVAELGDASLAALLRGARALLAPSLVEGFGLPVVEALALGVPVIASDIGAHREVGAAAADYVDPLDGPGWITALDDYVHDSPRRDAARQRARVYRAMPWSDHIRAVEELLTGEYCP